MDQLLAYRTNEFFKKYTNKYFLIRVIDTIYGFAKLIHTDGYYWFEYPTGNIKAITIECYPDDGLDGKKIQLIENSEIEGIITSLRLYDIKNVGIFWGQISNKSPRPYFWININELKLI
jgi:hypothetical protein